MKPTLQTKQDRQTRMIELVETHNLLRSLVRIKNAPGFDDQGRRWKRSLYHAMSMAYVSNSTLEKVRIALELP